MQDVTVVRIYLNEGEGQLKGLLKRLHDWEKVKGMTVFRGISGFGDSGVLHDMSLIDLSLNLPVIIEFFDTPEKVEAVLIHLDSEIKPGHMVKWSAQVNSDQ